MAAVVLVAHERATDAAKKTAASQLQADADRAAVGLAAYVQDQLGQLGTLARLASVRTTATQGDLDSNAQTAATAALTALAQRDTEATVACGILDRNGRCVLDGLRTASIGLDESHHDYARIPLHDGSSWSGHAEWIDSAWPSLVFAVPVRGDDGEVQGAVRLVLESTRLHKRLTAIGRHGDRALTADTIALLDAHGQVITDLGSPTHAFGIKRISAKTPPAGDLAEVDWFVAGATHPTNGYAALARVPGSAWRLMAWQSARSHDAPLAALVVGTAVQGGVLIALLLITAILASRLVAGPITRLEAAARQIADGSLNIVLPEGQDEVGSLGRTIQLMKDRLLAAMHELEDSAVSARAASQVKSQFLANMSHELRTPLTAILGYAEVVLEDADMPARSQDTIRTILRNADHLLQLVNEILDLAKVESGTMRVELSEFRAAKLVDDTAELLRIKARDKGIALVVDAPGPATVIRSDALRLRQILLNLAGNAIKFTDTGSVTIRASVSHDPDELVCEVADTGAGIPADQIEALFRPFSQVDSGMSRKHGGTGLGLSISQHFAKLLGGEITCTSTLGEGSVFRLRMPVECVEQKAKPRAAAPASGTPTIEGRILLVEDGPDNQRLFSHVLKKAGAEVTITDDGLAGVRALCVDGDEDGEAVDPLPFDMILMDMQMPVMDGYEATRRLRAKGITLPIVALTAHAMGDAKQECIDAGCDHCATKPIGGRALVQLCADWLGHRVSR